MRLSEMRKTYPLPWKHETNGGQMSAVVADNGCVVCGSLICEQGHMATAKRQAHAFIVELSNKEREL